MNNRMNNRMNKILNLRQELRASHVKRWHIVETVKTQSLAEHTYNVVMIATDICRQIKCDGGERAAIVMYALHHDLPEIIMGDIPTPTKIMMDGKYKREMRELEEDIDPLSTPPFPLAEDVVKLADIVDAVVFLNQYGIGSHAKMVREKLKLYGDLVAIDLELSYWFNTICMWETEKDDRLGVL